MINVSKIAKMWRHVSVSGILIGRHTSTQLAESSGKSKGKWKLKTRKLRNERPDPGKTTGFDALVSYAKTPNSYREVSVH